MFKATLCLSAATFILAQSAAGQNAGALASDEATSLQEIIVTAQRRSENLQNVPVSISVVSPEQLNNVGVRTTFDISSVVPGLTLTNTNGYVNASIRGVGSNIVGPGTENQIALYIDDVYQGGQAASVLDLVSVDQIAVLKGPQGTLFGRNATGGVLQVTTREPTDHFTGEADVSLGNYLKTVVDGYISGPLTDGLKADLAVTATHQSDGWGINRFNGQDASNIDYEITMRSKVIFTPADATKLTLIGDYSTINSTVLSSQTVLPGTISGWVPAKGVTPDIGYDINQDGPNAHQGYSSEVSLKWEQDLRVMRFMSITAYQQDAYNFDFDYDYGPEPIENIWVRQSRKQFTEELRLQSQPDNRLKWVAGFYYYYALAGNDNFNLLANDLGIYLTVHNFQRADSYAGFAQATYDIFADTNLTLGVRYTDEERKATDGRTDVTLLSGNIPLPTTVYPDQSTSAGQATYRASLDHRFSEQVLGFISFNTGFKSGGFNAGAPGSAPYLPEEIKAWEVGFKTDLIDKRLRLNVAGYHYDYTNMQVNQLNQGAVTVVNGAEAKIYGFDLDVTAAIWRGLTFTGGVDWAHPRFDSYPNCLYVPPTGGVAGVVASCAGNLIPLAPRLTFNTYLNYTTALPNGSLDLSANAYYNGGFSFTPDNSFNQGAYVNLAASASWISPNEKLRVTLGGRNLTDKRVATMMSENTGNGNVAAIWAAPRTYSITVGYKF